MRDRERKKEKSETGEHILFAIDDSDEKSLEALVLYVNRESI